MESLVRLVIEARLEKKLADFWQSIPNELRIKILSFLPSPDKFLYRRVSKEWKSLLDEKDIWIRTTRLTLGGTYWSTNEDGNLKLRLVENVSVSVSVRYSDDENEDDEEDEEDDGDDGDDGDEDGEDGVHVDSSSINDGTKVTAQDEVQDDGVQEVQVDAQDEDQDQDKEDVGDEEEDSKDEEDEEEGRDYFNQTDDSDRPPSEESTGAFFHNLIEGGPEWVLEVIQKTAPIRSLEIIDQEYRSGIDDLTGLMSLVEELEKLKTKNLVSLVISNVHYYLIRNMITLNSFVEKQSQLERLILGPCVQWSEFPDGPDQDSLGFFNYESYVQIGIFEEIIVGVVETALPELLALKDLEKLRVLVLYTCTIRELADLSPGPLNRLQVFIIVQFESDNLEEAETFVRKHAPSLHRRTDADFSLVWAVDETADVTTLVKRKTDSVDFLARFAEFKKTEEIREARVKVEEWRNREW